MRGDTWRVRVRILKLMIGRKRLRRDEETNFLTLSSDARTAMTAETAMKKFKFSCCYFVVVIMC